MAAPALIRQTRDKSNSFQVSSGSFVKYMASFGSRPQNRSINNKLVRAEPCDLPRTRSTLCSAVDGCSLTRWDAMILLDLLGTDIGFDCVSSRRSAWVPFSGQVAGINNRKDGRQFWTSLFGLPKISSYMQSTQNIYDKFLSIQDHLRNKRLLVAHDGKGKYCKYFRSETAYGTNIADDHVPFMNKG
ncbi:unnamed protein product, partial [Notodromas monacha]